MPKKRTPYLFLLPAILAIIVVSVIPIIMSFGLSFGDYNGYTGYEFKGFGNFARLARDPYFLNSLKNIAILLIVTIPAQIMLGLFLAYLLNEKFIRGRAIFRTTFYIPVITSGVAVTFLFSQLVSEDGLINNFLIALGGQALPFLEDATLARLVMMFIIIWKGVGYYITIFLAGMQAISEEVYEAADIDGASGSTKFFKITIPLLKPIIFFGVLMATIWGLNTFEVPNILFGGGQGPGQVASVPGTFLYQNIVVSPDYGYASAIAWIIAIISIFIAWLQFKVGDRND